MIPLIDAQIQSILILRFQLLYTFIYYSKFDHFLFLKYLFDGIPKISDFFIHGDYSNGM